MINLITGAPGAGKTNFLIEEIRKYESEGRPLFQHGITGLKLSNTKIYCRSPDCSECKNPPANALYVDEWTIWQQPHYVLIIDEVQMVWRPRGSQSTEIPVGLRGLETHRHEGIDFWFMTQHPSFLDVHARRLVTRHVHIKVTAIGRMLYDMPEACIDPTKPSVAGKLHRLNKKSFEEYESAKVHTKNKFSFPSGGKFFIIFFLVILPLVIYFIYSRVQNARTRLSAAVETTSENLSGFTSFDQDGFVFNTVSNSRATDSQVDPIVSDTKQFNYIPIVPNLPESAPAYSNLALPTTFPRVAACIKTDTRCQCYTQQGTKTNTDLEFCTAFTENRHFNSYLQESGDRYSARSSLNSPASTNL